MPFNYSGNDTFKTLPGGCLSLLTFFLVFSYLLLKVKHMHYREEWKMIQVDKESVRDELMVPIPMANQTNVTMAI